MNRDEISEWLEEWTRENLQETGYFQSVNEANEYAHACMIAANTAHIDIRILDKIAGGDLCKYFFDRHNTLIDNVVEHKASKKM